MPYRSWKPKRASPPLHNALQRILFSHGERERGILVERASRDKLELERSNTLDTLRETIEMSILLKAYLAQRFHVDSFDRIKDSYIEIFPSVSDVRVDFISELDPREARLDSWLAQQFLTVAIKEKSKSGWIISPYISSGMLRTFVHLAELELSPRDTTIVIDEYENSMGINCLPAVTDHFLGRKSELQFILTSHHPYVINNVPLEWWRLVTRTGSNVCVRSARDIPELDTRSRQDAFTLLTNSEVYEEEIQ